jgi:hypothetical protein
MSEKIPSIGRVVHYVLEAGPHQGDHRPAFIVRVWDDTPGMVNLQVFTDGENDQYPHNSPPSGAPMVIWRTSVHRDDTGKPGTWHWPEYVPDKA